MKISCPSKTFLCGEYTVLEGGPSILLATPPYFKLENNIFDDPYNNMGGFGASGAKFIFNTFQEKNNSIINPWQLWNHYKKSSLLGSGADIMCQLTGGISFFYPQEKILEALSWPFENLIVILIHTGNKLLTHEHLNYIHTYYNTNQKKISDQFELLNNIVFNIYYAFKNNQPDIFVKNIQAYHTHLNNLQFVCESTQYLLSQICKQPQVLAAKGCGAMGSDVILTVIQRSDKKIFLNWAGNQKLNIIYADNHFAHGAGKLL